MTTAPNPVDRRRTTLLRVAVSTWLLLISGAVLIDHVALSNFAEQAETRAPGAQVAVLESRWTELSQAVEQLQQRPVTLPQAHYEADRQALDLRLVVIEQALGERLTADSLQVLQARVAQLEARPAQRQANRVTPRAGTTASAKPKPAEPSFQVIGAELRAGERFLSILPADTTALAHVRLLRTGEEEGSCWLEAIDGDAAVFRQTGETRRVSIPQR